VAYGQLGANPRGAGLQRDDRLAMIERLARRRAELGRVLQSLDVQPDGAHFGPVAENLDEILQPHHRLVARRDHIGEGNGALAHGQIGGQHAALGDDGGTVARAGPAVREGPEGRPVDIVDHAVTVRPDQRHLAGRLDQRRFGSRALGAGFPEAGGVADHAAGTQAAQAGDAVDGGRPGYGYEHRIGRLGQVLDLCETSMPGDLPPLRIDRPQGAGETDAGAFPHHRFRVPAADDGDMARLQQTPEIGAQRRRHAPSGRRIERAMM
jgi:hypothetical protein